ncbi:macrophage mannose receptor 1-like [Diadema antillarum]|uniref:macrophage mannose receptor 1-like n=1 Tax=Diadema antillarum TaxID=105358 RepID=UPI003A89F455
MSGNCYYLSDVWRNFDDAQTYCEQFDANLMDVKDEDEQALLVDLVIEAGLDSWIGYRTDNGKNNFAWTSGATWNYQKWGPNEPGDNLQMCTWVESASTLTGNWSTGNCNDWLRFICEKPQGMCYPGWKMHNGFCYQLSANEPTTWMYAKEYCEKEGAVLLTIKSEVEQEFINQQLSSLSQSGIENLWFGISESSNGQWDYGDCINEYSFACKIREGSAVKPVDPDVPTGYCPEHWYHYESNCYYINNTGITFDEAEQICVNYGGHLASIHSGGEMSFIELRLSERDYYIGLGDRDTEGVYTWTDGTPFDYRNWDLNEPNDRGGTEECVHVRGPYVTPSGVWNDISCDAQYSFICKKAAATTTPVPPTNPPDVSCYEPYSTYLGNAQVTVDGDACLNWKDANRRYNPTDYPDAHLDGNYCRNPAYGPRPWCYVADEDIDWKECDVPQCNAPTDCYEGDGYLYRGKAAETSGGNKCLPWSSLDNRAYYRPETFPEEG